VASVGFYTLIFSTVFFTFPYDRTSSSAPGIRFFHTPLLHKQALQFLKGIANLPWVNIVFSNP